MKKYTNDKDLLTDLASNKIKRNETIVLDEREEESTESTGEAN